MSQDERAPTCRHVDAPSATSVVWRASSVAHRVVVLGLTALGLLGLAIVVAVFFFGLKTAFFLLGAIFVPSLWDMLGRSARFEVDGRRGLVHIDVVAWPRRTRTTFTLDDVVRVSVGDESTMSEAGTCVVLDLRDHGEVRPLKCAELSRGYHARVAARISLAVEDARAAR